MTGATGFIGGHLTERLIQQGDEVVVLVRDESRASGLEAIGAQIVRGDVTEKDSFVVPMRDVDGVFHLAAYYKVGGVDPFRAERVNVAGTRNVLEAMRENAIEKGVYTSTLAVFGDTGGKRAREGDPYNGPKGTPWSSADRSFFLSAYDRTKWAAHHEVAKPMMAAGLPLVIVQPGVVYGPRDPSAIGRLLRRYLRRRLPVVPAQTGFSWAHVEDVARAHIQAMDLGVPGEEYITSGPSRSLVDVLRLAEEHTGIPAPRMLADPKVLRGLSHVTGALEAVGLPVAETYASETLRVAAGVTYMGDDAKAREALGFDPRSLEQGLPPVLEAEMRRLGIVDVRV